MISFVKLSNYQILYDDNEDDVAIHVWNSGKPTFLTRSHSASNTSLVSCSVSNMNNQSQQQQLISSSLEKHGLPQQRHSHSKCNPIACFVRLFPRRYAVVIMLFLGLFNIYLMRVNLSVAIDPMACEYGWSNKIQGYILSSFFLGYMFNFTAGPIATRFGGKKVFGIGVLTTSILTLLIPICASGKLLIKTETNLNCICKSNISKNWCFINGIYTQSGCNTLSHNESNILFCDESSNVYAIIILRILTGLFECVTYPSLYNLLGNWSLPKERSRMVGISFAGAYAGNVIGFPIANIILDHTSWIYIFYVMAFCGIIWFILWMVLVYDNIFDDPYITNQEFELLRTNIANYENYQNLGIKTKKNIKNTVINYNNSVSKSSSKEKNIKNIKNIKNVSFIQEPRWKDILTNKVIVSMYIMHFTNNWGYYTFLVESNKYLTNGLNFDSNKAAYMTCIFYGTQCIASIIVGIKTDQIIDKYTSRHGASNIKLLVRKVVSCVHSIIPGILLLFVVYSRNVTCILILITFAFTCLGFSAGGYSVCYMEVSPTRSHVLYAVSNTFATLPGVISPILSGYILNQYNNNNNNNNNSMFGWKVIFFISSGFFFLGAIVLLMFLKTDRIDVLNAKVVKIKQKSSKSIDETCTNGVLTVPHNAAEAGDTDDVRYSTATTLLGASAVDPVGDEDESLSDVEFQ